MPMELLFSEEEIHKGDTSVIVPLLKQMRKAWGHHLPGTPTRRPGTPARERREEPRLAYRSPARQRAMQTPSRWRQ